MRRLLQISAAVAALLLCAMIFHAWLASRDDQIRMQAVIKAQSQLIDAANSREHDRAIALDQTLAEIEKLKRETQTPQQILEDLPKYLPLPEPITIAGGGDPSGEARRASTQTRVEVDPGARAGEKGILGHAEITPPRVLNSLVGKFGFVRRALGSRAASSAVESQAADFSHDHRTNDATDAATDAPAGAEHDSGPPSLNSSETSPRQRSGSKKNSERELPDAPRPATHGQNPPAGDARGAALSSSDGKSSATSPSSQNSTTDRTSSTRTPTEDPAAEQATAMPASAEIPAADLKPLYDYVQDCRSCKVQLNAAKQDHLDDAAKLVEMTRERDAAVAAAEGGTLWRRFRRNAAWLVVGAVAVTATKVVFSAAGHRVATR